MSNIKSRPDQVATMQEKMIKLREELDRPDAEAGTVNVYGVALLQAYVLDGGIAQWSWVIGALSFAVIALLALGSIAVGAGYHHCLYDDDCELGTVCMYITHRNIPLQSTKNRGLCLDCNMFDPQLRLPTTWLTSLVGNLIGLDLDHVMEKPYNFTPVRTGDRWPYSDSAADYCNAQLDDPAVSAWMDFVNRFAEDPRKDFKKCLFMKAASLKMSSLDNIILYVAFMLVCAQIATDRQQQLFNQHMRALLLPPPWRSVESAAFKLLEILLEGLLSSVVVSLALIIFGNGEVASVSILLNGVAIAFVLQIDDELPRVLVSDTDQNALDSFAQEVGDKALMLVIKRKGQAHGAASFIMLHMIYVLIVNGMYKCNDMVVDIVGVCMFLPFCARFAEELATVQYTLHVHTHLSVTARILRSLCFALGDALGAVIVFVLSIRISISLHLGG